MATKTTEISKIALCTSRWRRQQAELDAMLKESQQSQELQASAAEDMSKLRDLQASLRTQLGLPSLEVWPPSQGWNLFVFLR